MCRQERLKFFVVFSDHFSHQLFPLVCPLYPSLSFSLYHADTHTDADTYVYLSVRLFVRLCTPFRLKIDCNFAAAKNLPNDLETATTDGRTAWGSAHRSGQHHMPVSASVAASFLNVITRHFTTDSGRQDGAGEQRNWVGMGRVGTWRSRSRYALNIAGLASRQIKTVSNE